MLPVFIYVGGDRARRGGLDKDGREEKEERECGSRNGNRHTIWSRRRQGWRMDCVDLIKWSTSAGLGKADRRECDAVADVREVGTS